MRWVFFVLDFTETPFFSLVKSRRKKEEGFDRRMDDNLCFFRTGQGWVCYPEEPGGTPSTGVESSRISFGQDADGFAVPMNPVQVRLLL